MGYLAVAGLVIVLAVLWRGLGGYAAPATSLRNLSRIDAAVFKAAAQATFPAGGEISPSFSEAKVVEYCDDYVGWLSPSQRVLIRLLLVLFEHATLVFVPSFRRMSSMSVTEQVKYLDGWDQSPLYLRRMAFQSLRAILCMAYLADDEVNRQIGNVRSGACVANAVGTPGAVQTAGVQANKVPV
jgi:hypothetical protein